MAFVDPLNLQDLLVFMFAGNELAFILLAFLVIAILAARFKMPNIVFGGMLLVFIVIMMTTELGQGTELKGFMLMGGIFLALVIGAVLVAKSQS